MVSCAYCDPGYYSISTVSSGGVVSCTPCDAGKYSNITGTIICTACGLGTYTDVPGLPNCILWSSGVYVIMLLVSVFVKRAIQQLLFEFQLN